MSPGLDTIDPSPTGYVKAVRLPDGAAQPDELTEDQISQLLAG